MRKAEKTSFRDVEKNLNPDKEMNCIERVTKQILIFMVNRYVYLHKMNNLFIDKRKRIFYKINQRREPILRMMNGAIKSYSLDDESYERLVAILKRKDKCSDDVGGKVTAIENDVRNVLKQMENLKNMLDEITLKLENN